MNNMMSNTMSNVKVSINTHDQRHDQGDKQQMKNATYNNTRPKKNSTTSIPQAITQEKIKCNEEYKTKKNSKAKYQT